MINNIAKFIRKQNNSRGHEKYAASFMLCQVRPSFTPSLAAETKWQDFENLSCLKYIQYTYYAPILQVLSLLNVVLNFAMLDTFFQGEFRSFGARWINSLMLNPDKYSRVQSVLNDIFPKARL